MQLGKLVSDDRVIAEPVEYATALFERLKGLLGRNGLSKSTAMIIEHCGSVHTIGMRFALDLIFLDKEWRVLSIKRNINPGRPMISGGLRAKRVIESQTGALDMEDFQIGHKLVLELLDG